MTLLVLGIEPVAWGEQIITFGVAESFQLGNSDTRSYQWSSQDALIATFGANGSIGAIAGGPDVVVIPEVQVLGATIIPEVRQDTRSGARLTTDISGRAGVEFHAGLEYGGAGIQGNLDLGPRLALPDKIRAGRFFSMQGSTAINAGSSLDVGLPKVNAGMDLVLETHGDVQFEFGLYPFAGYRIGEFSFPDIDFRLPWFNLDFDLNLPDCPHVSFPADPDYNLCDLFFSDPYANDALFKVKLPPSNPALSLAEFQVVNPVKSLQSSSAVEGNKVSYEATVDLLRLGADIDGIIGALTTGTSAFTGGSVKVPESKPIGSIKYDLIDIKYGPEIGFAYESTIEPFLGVKLQFLDEEGNPTQVLLRDGPDVQVASQWPLGPESGSWDELPEIALRTGQPVDVAVDFTGLEALFHHNGRITLEDYMEIKALALSFKLDLKEFGLGKLGNSILNGVLDLPSLGPLYYKKLSLLGEVAGFDMFDESFPLETFDLAAGTWDDTFRITPEPLVDAYLVGTNSTTAPLHLASSYRTFDAHLPPGDLPSTTIILGTANMTATSRHDVTPIAYVDGGGGIVTVEGFYVPQGSSYTLSGGQATWEIFSSVENDGLIEAQDRLELTGIGPQLILLGEGTARFQGPTSAIAADNIIHDADHTLEYLAGAHTLSASNLLRNDGLISVAGGGQLTLGGTLEHTGLIMASGAQSQVVLGHARGAPGASMGILMAENGAEILSNPDGFQVNIGGKLEYQAGAGGVVEFAKRISVQEEGQLSLVTQPGGTMVLNGLSLVRCTFNCGEESDGKAVITNHGLLEVMSGVNSLRVPPAFFGGTDEIVPIDLVNEGTIRVHAGATFAFDVAIENYRGDGATLAGGVWELRGANVPFDSRTHPATVNTAETAVIDVRVGEVYRDGQILSENFPLDDLTTALKTNAADVILAGAASFSYFNTLEVNLGTLMLDQQQQFYTAGQYQNRGGETRVEGGAGLHVAGPLMVSDGLVAITGNGSRLEVAGGQVPRSDGLLVRRDIEINGGLLQIADEAIFDYRSGGRTWVVRDLVKEDPLGAPVVTPGTFDLGSRKILVNGNHIRLAGASASFDAARHIFNNAGTLAIAQGNRFESLSTWFTNGASGLLQLTAGQFVINGALTNYGELSIDTDSYLQAASLQLFAGESRVDGVVHADVQIGHGATLSGGGTFTGSLTQFSSGIIELALFGPDSSETHDLVEVMQEAALQGMLAIIPADDYADPSIRGSIDAFSLLEADERIGQFATVHYDQQQLEADFISVDTMRTHVGAGLFRNIGYHGNHVELMNYLALAGDANGDLTVDNLDLDIWQANQGVADTNWIQGDFNGDHVTDNLDFAIWEANQFASASLAVPEPGTMLLLASTAIILLAAGRGARRATVRRENTKPARRGAASASCPSKIGKLNLFPAPLFGKMANRLIVGLLLAAVCRMPVDTRAAFYDWDGGGGDDSWVTPENWNPDGLPGAGDNLLLTVMGQTIDVGGGQNILGIEANGALGTTTFVGGNLFLHGEGNALLTGAGGGALQIDTNIQLAIPANGTARFNVTPSGAPIVVNGDISVEPLGGGSNAIMLELTSRNLSAAPSIALHGVISDGESGPELRTLNLTAGFEPDASNHRGVVELTGLNTYSGTTDVNAATLIFHSLADVGGGPSALGAPTTIATGTIDVGTANRVGTLRYEGAIVGGHGSDRIIHLAGSNSGARIEASGVGPLALSGGLTTASSSTTRTLTLGGANLGDNTFSGIIPDAVGTGKLDLVKTGPGKWILSNTNTYQGDTRVEQGALEILSGTIANSRALLLADQPGLFGALTVAGPGTTLSTTLSGSGVDGMSVGLLGNGILHVVQGAVVTAATGTAEADIVLGVNPGAEGTLNVADPGSQVLGEDLFVRRGQLTVSNGGVLDLTASNDALGIVGSAGGGVGSALVTGDGSRWNMDRLAVASFGRGTFEIAAGGRVETTRDTLFASDSSAAVGSMQIHGSGAQGASTLAVGNDLILGLVGQGDLRIEQGAEATVGGDTIVGDAPGNNRDNRLTLTSPGSTLTTGNLFAARQGNGTISVLDGATTAAQRLRVGELADSTGAVNLSGADARIDLSADAVVGTGGIGTLGIAAGGAVDIGEFLSIGYHPAGVGIVTIAGGAGGQPSSLTAGTELSIGHSGNGALQIVGGGTLVSSAAGNWSASIGQEAGSTGSVTVSGAGSHWEHQGNARISIGLGGGTVDAPARLDVVGGGSVTTHDFLVADVFGSYGEVSIDGEDSSIALSGRVIVGDSGPGGLRLSNGASFSAVEKIEIGGTADGSGQVEVNGLGSRLATSANLVVGRGGLGSLRITGGGEVVTNPGAGTSTVIGNDTTSFNSSVLIDGEGSRWIDGYEPISMTQSGVEFHIGNSGGSSTLPLTMTIQNGGLLQTGRGVMARLAGSFVTSLVTGAGSTWSNQGLIVGQIGEATLEVEEGGLVEVDGLLELGNNAAFATGNLNIAGVNALVEVTSAVSVGDFNNARGSISLRHGGRLALTNMAGGAINLGEVAGAQGKATVGTPDAVDFTAVLSSASNLNVGGNNGGNGGTGELTVALTGAVEVANNLTVFDQGVVHLQGGSVSVSGVTIVHGGGAFHLDQGVLRAGTLDLTGGGLFDFTGGILRGDSVLGNLVHDAGALAAGPAAGTTVVSGDYTQNAGGDLLIDVSSLALAPGQDVVTVTGNASLNGQLQLALNGDFAPGPADAFSVFRAGSLLGDFVNVANGDRLALADRGGSFQVHYGPGSLFDPNQIVLSGFQFAADFDNDGQVAGDDFLIWQTHVGTETGATRSTGDSDGDGDVDQDDLDPWRAYFGRRVTGNPALTSVPEPGCLTLLAWAAIGPLSGRRARGGAKRKNG